MPIMLFIDAVYKTEKFVGRAIKESGLARSELFVTTKYFGEVPVQKSVRESLKNVNLLLNNPI